MGDLTTSAVIAAASFLLGTLAMHWTADHLIIWQAPLTRDHLLTALTYYRNTYLAAVDADAAGSVSSATSASSALASAASSSSSAASLAATAATAAAAAAASVAASAANAAASAIAAAVSSSSSDGVHPLAADPTDPTANSTTPALTSARASVVLGVGAAAASLVVVKMLGGGESNWLFDGASLFLFASMAIVYVQKIVPNLARLPALVPSPAADPDDPRDATTVALKELASSHAVVACALVGVLILQSGQYYSERLGERERIEDVEARVRRRRRKLEAASAVAAAQTQQPQQQRGQGASESANGSADATSTATASGANGGHRRAHVAATSRA